ncbi:hypothetical protein CP97_00310 [Aurantiacibacter atlanticus]|uniref:Lipoprotein n=1 Tax=Aurantiacibacter atlanticus TaxID=1648404 RepID=A0A0H4VCL6_9SPHN|nr:hypothetical protein [Aurantiacibacter atlanticus]AKQ40824.1 hypothetical protein CP97_00310 [Aurantiacibacter atlanticus]
MIRPALISLAVMLLAACTQQAEQQPLWTFDENGRIVTAAGNAPSACVEPAAIPAGATQETSGRLTILEAPLPAPFISLQEDWPPEPENYEPKLARPAVPAELAYYVRAFPQEEQPAGDVLSIASEHVIFLRDGCFFADIEGDDDPLVMFPFGAALIVDEDGFLAFGSRYKPNAAGNVRVGLPAQTGMVSPLFDAPEEVSKACGHRKMIAVTSVSNPFDYPERFNPALRRYGERSGAIDKQILERANRCAIDAAKRQADRRLRTSALEPINCNRFWGF